MLHFNNPLLPWSQYGTGHRPGTELSYLFQLLDGVFLLVLDFLLLEGTGFQLPEPLLQASDTVFPQRGQPQQLPLMGLQRLHLLLQLRRILLLFLQTPRGQRSGVA